jgi:hypothetical protein
MERLSNLPAASDEELHLWPELTERLLPAAADVDAKVAFELPGVLRADLGAAAHAL